MREKNTSEPIDARVIGRKQTENSYELHLQMDMENLVKLLDLAVEVGIMEKVTYLK